jgi:hypothetical protein
MGLRKDRIMGYKLRIKAEPVLAGNGKIRCQIEIYKDGILMAQRLEDRLYIRNDDPDLDTKEKRIAAFRDAFASEPEALANADLDLAERQKAIGSDIEETDLSDLDGFETAEY